MFIKILYTIVITVLIFLITGLLLPKTVHVERSIEIDRPLTTVFVLLNSNRSFEVLAPWMHRDPDTTYRYSGPDSGVGARLDWSGDPRLVGNGWQEIIESRPLSLIRMQLFFEQQGPATSFFYVDPIGPGVTLTWGFDVNLVKGQTFIDGLLARYFGLFFDRWIGTDYEQGLMRFKTYAESTPSADFSDLEVEIVRAEPLDILYIAIDGPQAPGGVTSKLASAYQEIGAFMAEHSIEMQSQPMAITRARGARNYGLDAAIPVTEINVPVEGRIQAGESPSGIAVRVIHRGSYDELQPTYEKLAAYMAVHGLREGRVSWEHYISDPGRTRPEEVITHIYFLIEDQP